MRVILKKFIILKMKLTKKEVLHVAKLAKLSLSKDEIKRFGGQLANVISYFNELKDVETKGVEATSQTTGLTNVSKADSRQSESLSVEKALSGVDSGANGYFVVPQVVTKDE